MSSGNWDCEAYGPELRAAGALCFFADPGTRTCATQDECRQSVAAARQVLFQRMNELAAHNPGDQTWEYLAGTFASPGQVLGGGDPPPDPDGGSDG